MRRTPDFIDLEVTNPNVDGLALRDLPFAAEAGVVFSRLLRNGQVTVPEDDSVIRLGDGLRLVGPRAKLLKFEPVIGRKSSIDIKSVPSELTTEHLYVTKGKVLGKSLGELNYERAYGVVITRITRADVEFAANDQVRLQFGDFLFVVGSKDGVAQVGELVGNTPKALDHPHVLPVFVGILLGVILGSLPIALPGMPAPVRLGLAGGPLIVALVLSQVGRLGPLIWYLSPAANLALREIGIVLFLACVGLKSGSRFLEVLLSGSGFYWMAAGAVLTFVPLVIVGFLARKVLQTGLSNDLRCSFWKHDRPACASIRNDYYEVRSAACRLCSGLPVSDDIARFHRASSDLNAANVRKSHPDSPAGISSKSEQTFGVTGNGRLALQGIGHPRRLACGFEDRPPNVAFRVDFASTSNHYPKRNMNECIMPTTDQHICLSGHSGMNRALS